MNNKKVFSIPLFVNNFLQLKLVGILAAIIMAVIPLFTLISHGSANLNYFKQTGDITATSVTISDFPVLIATFIVVTPILMLMAFNYNNKRNSSDFYNSLPYTRLNMYLTKLAAVLAWQLIMFAAVFVAVAVPMAIYHEYFVYSVSSLIWTFVGIVVCNLICGASIVLACSVTGNLISNICLSGLIMFLPATLSQLMIFTVNNMFEYASDTVTVPVIGTMRNMLVNVVFGNILGFGTGVYTTGGVTGTLANRSSMLYTVVLAVIYAAIGLYFFNRRKSEIAGKATVGNKAQFAIRTIIGFIILDFAVLAVVTSLDAMSFVDVVLPVGLVIISAFIAMLVYELLTGDKTLLLKKTAISFAAAFVCSIVFTGIIAIGAGRMKAYNPDADKISYVKIESGDYRFNSNYSSDNYYNTKLSSFKIKDKEAIKKFVDAYDNCKDKEITEFYKAKDARFYDIDIYFKDGLLGRHRKILINSNQYNDIVNSLSKSKEYQNIYLSLPDSNGVNIGFNNSVPLDQSEAKKIYESAKEEIKNADFVTYMTARQSSGVCDKLRVQFIEDGVEWNIRVPLTAAIPKTTSMYMRMVSEKSKSLMVNGADFEAVRSVIINSINKGVLTQNIGKSAVLNIYRIDIPNAEQDILYADSIYDGEDLSDSQKPYHGGDNADMTSAAMLEEIKDKLNDFDNSITIDPSKPFYQVDFGIYGYTTNSEYYSDTFYFYLQ